MATVTKPIALDESFNTTEVTPRNIADVLAEGFSHITGRTASEVEYDNTDSGLTADNVQDALDEIVEDIPTVPSVDIQTAVDEFETYNGGLLSSLKVSLTPNQDLHGYDSPWVGGAGKNKFSDTLYKDNYGINSSGSEYASSSYYIAVENLSPSENYVISTIYSGTSTSQSLRVQYYDSDDNVLSMDSVTLLVNARTILAFTTPATTAYAHISINKQNTNIQIESGTTATDFEPYSNICPISGHTEVDIDVSDGQATQEQVTVNLGGTYYSGTLDVVSGVFVPDTAGKDLSTLTFRTASRNRWLSDSIISEVKHPSSSSVKIGFWSDSYYYTDAQNLYDDQTLIGIAVDNDGNILCRNGDNVNTPTGYIVYELATPTPIQLSPTMVKALVGENHLSAPLEGQEITESKYKKMFTFDDVIAYIQSLS